MQDISRHMPINRNGRSAPTPVVSQARLFGELRVLAEKLSRTTQLTNLDRNGPHVYSRKNLIREAERFKGAYDFVMSVTGGIPEAALCVGGLDMREIHNRAISKAGQYASRMGV